MQKLIPKLTTLILITAFVVLYSGCSKRALMNPYKKQEFNLLGIVHNKPASYQPVKKVSLPISYRDVLFNRENYSGRELRLLWGLITITDY